MHLLGTSMTSVLAGGDMARFRTPWSARSTRRGKEPVRAIEARLNVVTGDLERATIQLEGYVAEIRRGRGSNAAPRANRGRT